MDIGQYNSSATSGLGEQPTHKEINFIA